MEGAELVPGYGARGQPDAAEGDLSSSGQVDVGPPGSTSATGALLAPLQKSAAAYFLEIHRLHFARHLRSVKRF